MEKEFYILVVDRNKHVRRFLKRELERSGYSVLLAKDRHDLLRFSFIKEDINLIIVDPGMSDAIKGPTIETIHVSFPDVPIILHGHWPDKVYCACNSSIVACVEKKGDSIEKIQQIILDMIRQKNHGQTGTEAFILNLAEN